MLLMDTAVDKCNYDVSIHLVEVVDILLFCVSAEHLKKDKNLTDLIPALKRWALCGCTSVGLLPKRSPNSNLFHVWQVEQSIVLCMWSDCFSQLARHLTPVEHAPPPLPFPPLPSPPLPWQSSNRLTHNVSYSQRSRKLAVGSKSGRVCIYDFKHFNCDSVNAHSSAVTTLQLSEDGKMLASYAHGDSALKVWQVWGVGVVGCGRCGCGWVWQVWVWLGVAGVGVVGCDRYGVWVWLGVTGMHQYGCGVPDTQ